MLLNPAMFTNPVTPLAAVPPIDGLETKSANANAEKSGPRQVARRYRPRRTTAERVHAALVQLAEGQGELITHEETTWTSITFAGTRHEVMLEFAGEVAIEAGEDFIIALPEHEFTIPGQLVADATIKEVDHTFGAQERLVVTAVLLLLEES